MTRGAKKRKQGLRMFSRGGDASDDESLGESDDESDDDDAAEDGAGGEEAEAGTEEERDADGEGGSVDDSEGENDDDEAEEARSGTNVITATKLSKTQWRVAYFHENRMETCTQHELMARIGVDLWVTKGDDSAAWTAERDRRKILVSRTIIPSF